MSIFLQLLAAYGLAFGFQQKATFLHKGKFLTALFACTYCTGFHCGWMVWGLNALYTCEVMGGCWPSLDWSTLPFYCFGSAAWCYAVDAGVRYMESNSGDEG